MAWSRTTQDFRGYSCVVEPSRTHPGPRPPVQLRCAQSFGLTQYLDDVNIMSF